MPKFLPIACLAALLGAGIASSACHAQHATQGTLHPPQLKREALPAPRFTFRDLDGKEHHLSEERGKVVVLNFWGTWCPGCVLEMPTLQALYDRYHADPKVVFLAVSSIDTPEKVKKFRETNHFTIPMYLVGNDTLPKGFDSGAWPATYIFSSDGVIRAEHLGGANWTDPSVIQLIDELKRR